MSKDFGVICQQDVQFYFLANHIPNIDTVTCTISSENECIIGTPPYTCSSHLTIVRDIEYNFLIGLKIQDGNMKFFPIAVSQLQAFMTPSNRLAGKRFIYDLY